MSDERPTPEKIAEGCVLFLKTSYDQPNAHRRARERIVGAIRAEREEADRRVKYVDGIAQRACEERDKARAELEAFKARVRSVLSTRRDELERDWLCLDHGGDEAQAVAWHLFDIARQIGIDLESEES